MVQPEHPRPDHQAFLLESAWVLPSVALPVAMFVALLVTTFVAGSQMPGITQTIDPAKIDQTAPFNTPGVVQVGPDEFNATMIAEIWQWVPNTIKVPVGAKVNFAITSRDVMHGFFVVGTNVNLMITPGYITRATHVFKQAGTYRIECQEYCGLGHQGMIGQVVVGGQ